MKPLISLIIPVYNTEPFLRQCLESVAQQTLGNIEVIIINNNTPDNSPVIIDEYVKKYPHFKTTLLVGGKVGGARNAGLKMATGQYVAFLDSDDWIAPDALEKLYTAAKQNDADIVVCSANNTDLYGQVTGADDTSRQKPFTLTNAPAVQLLKIGGEMACPWRKIIRRSIFTEHDLWFPENVSAEDVACICACFAFSKNYVQLADRLWYYRNRPGSLSNTNAQQAPIYLFDNFAAVRPLLKKYGIYDEVAEEFEFRLISMIIGNEGYGNGGFKKLTAQNRRKLFEKCRTFYLSFPKDFFKNRNQIFRTKWFIFHLSLKLNRPALPVILRGPLHILYLFCKK